MKIPVMLRRIGVQKAILIVLFSLPMVGLFVSLFVSPAADPYERIARETGETALRLLVLTMLVTPLVMVTQWKKALPFRRTLGVLAFAYALVHALAYMVFEAGFDIFFVVDDVLERNFIAVGMAAFLLMLPLGLTSNNYSVRKLGRNWRKLHRLAYPIALLAPLHFLMLKRDEDLTEPLVYLFIFIALLSARVVSRLRQRAKSMAT